MQMESAIVGEEKNPFVLHLWSLSEGFEHLVEEVRIDSSIYAALNALETDYFIWSDRC